jgi:hypothetical protein
MCICCTTFPDRWFCLASFGLPLLIEIGAQPAVAAVGEKRNISYV